MHRSARRRIVIVLACVCVLCATSLILRLVARQMLFRGAGRTGNVAGDVRHLVLRSADGAAVHAYELPLLGAPVVVHFHDNRQTVADALSFGRALWERGLAVVLVEYRGYGDSRHLTPDEHALYADAETVLDALAARGITRDHVVLSGRSLGTGVAAEMAKRGRGAALVLLAPFSSIPDLVPALGFLVADRFATGEKAAQIGVPTLIVHGDRDEIVPFAMGVELSHAIPRATLLRVDGASHGDISDRPAVLGSIASFARVHG